MRPHMQLVTTYQDANLLAQRILNADWIAVDTESSGPKLVDMNFINMFKSTTTGISISLGSLGVFYVPIGHHAGNCPGEDVERILHALTVTGAQLWAHNWKHDLKAFDCLDCNLRGSNLKDTQIMMWLLGEETSTGHYGIKDLAKEKLGFEMATFETTLRDHATFADLTPQEALQYACDDAIAVRLLVEKYYKRISGMDLSGAFQREMRMVRVLRSMEDTGVALDVLRISDLHREVQASREPLLAEWDWLVGCNPNSGKQLNEKLFAEGHWPTSATIKSKKSGLYSTKAEFMENILLACKPGSIGERAAQIKQELNVLGKIESTYSSNLIDIARQYPDGRLHPFYHATGTATGRLSSSYPNAQNVPVRSNLGKRVQECFRGAEGYSIVSADYSQIELRVMAHIAGSGPLYDGYRLGTDVHQATADKLGVDRNAGKTINFAVLYGAGAKKLAKTIGTTLEHAKQLLEDWNEDNASVIEALDSYKREGYVRGYVRLESGRVRLLSNMLQRSVEQPRCPYRFGSPESDEFYETVLKPRWSDERKAGNTPIQGFAADIVKEAMITAYDEGLTIQAQIHDDIKLEVSMADAQDAAKDLQKCMEGAWKLKVPLVAEASIGENWLAAKG